MKINVVFCIESPGHLAKSPVSNSGPRSQYDSGSGRVSRNISTLKCIEMRLVENWMKICGRTGICHMKLIIISVLIISLGKPLIYVVLKEQVTNGPFISQIGKHSFKWLLQYNL